MMKSLKCYLQFSSENKLILKIDIHSCAWYDIKFCASQFYNSAESTLHIREIKFHNKCHTVKFRHQFFFSLGGKMNGQNFLNVKRKWSFCSREINDTYIADAHMSLLNILSADMLILELEKCIKEMERFLIHLERVPTVGVC